MKKIILLLIAIAAITAGCKKYPDGPMFSLRSANHRILGTYKAIQYTVNGADSLSMLNDSIPFSICLKYDPVDEVNGGFAKWYIGKGKYSIVSSSWKLIEKNKKIAFSYIFGYYSNSNSYYTITWTILKLTNNETKWETINNNKEYIITLQKQ